MSLVRRRAAGRVPAGGRERRDWHRRSRFDVGYPTATLRW